MPTSNKPTLLSPVLLRVAGLSIDVLDELRAPVITYRLEQYAYRCQQLDRQKEPLLNELFAFIEKQCPAGKPQQLLQQIRRDLHNDRAVRAKEVIQAEQWLPERLLLKLRTYIEDRQAVAQYLRTTAKLYQQQAIQGRQHFQRLVGDPAFQRGLALSSLSLLRQATSYRQTHPARFRKDDFQVENGLLRYLSRAATKTTPYSTLTHLATVPIHAGESYEWATGPSRSHVRLSVRLLGVFETLLRTNRRLYEQWPVTVNPGVLLTGNSLSYIRQTNGQVSCVRISVNPALRWVVRSRATPWLYTNWVEQLQQRFRSTSREARQYVDKLIELGVLQHSLPVSAADPDWAVRLLDWLIEHQWVAARFVDGQLSLLKALLATADLLPIATPGQRQTLLVKAQSVLAEHISQLSQPPPTDFWPLRPEQLFFEDVTRPVQGHLPKQDMKRLIAPVDRLTNHIATAYTASSHGLTDLFKTSYAATETVPITTFFAHYLSQSEHVPTRSPVRPAIRAQWEQWATAGLREQTVFLTSEWIPDSVQKTVSQGVFWQSWFDRKGRLHAALNELAGGFGRLYGRFLPYFSPSLTHELTRSNRAVAQTDCLLVEATDDHFHNANFHPALLDGVILTPTGHLPADSRQKILLNELSIRLSENGQQLILFHAPSQKRVQVIDMGFQATRSRLYTFLSQFRPVPELSLTLFTSVVNQWYEQQQPAGSVRIWPRIVLDRQLIIQRQTWWLPVGTDDTLPIGEDAFAFFRATHNWKQRHQLPEEVFVSLPGTPSADDRKPQYIRFDSPLLVDLFRRLVRKAVAARVMMKIVEMRPTSDELPCINGHRFAVEAVPQWYTARTSDTNEASLAEAAEHSQS